MRKWIWICLLALAWLGLALPAGAELSEQLAALREQLQVLGDESRASFPRGPGNALGGSVAKALRALSRAASHAVEGNEGAVTRAASAAPTASAPSATLARVRSPRPPGTAGATPRS